MKLSDFAKQILNGEDIADKVFDEPITEFDTIDFSLPNKPGRNKKILLSAKNIKFPKGHFHLTEKKAIALHSFANHELLATEMMAAALLLYPHDTPELMQFKKGIISTLKDEQKHFKLYVERLNEIGYEFGDFELNDYFWNQMKYLSTPSEYLSVMALTFEAANLDFAKYYHDEFKSIEDNKTADILKTVLKDEISHVAFGVKTLTKWKGNSTLKSYYRENLPGQLTPARSKGKKFYDDLRVQARMDADFIDWIKNYHDDFKITQRKEWKK